MIVMNAASPIWIGLAAVVWVALSAGTPSLAADAGASSDRATRGDRHTLGNPGEVRVTHLDLDLTVHFDRKELAGVAVLDVERQPGVGEGVPLQVDTRGLTIANVGTR